MAVAALKAGAADYVVKTPGDEFFDLLRQRLPQRMEQVRLRRQAAEAEEAMRDAPASGSRRCSAR